MHDTGGELCLDKSELAALLRAMGGSVAQHYVQAIQNYPIEHRLLTKFYDELQTTLESVMGQVGPQWDWVPNACVRLSSVTLAKDQGDAAFKRGNFDDAIRYYNGVRASLERRLLAGKLCAHFACRFD